MNQITRNSFFLLLSSALFVACGNSTGNAAAMNGAASDKGAAGSALSGDASFSATIDGQSVSGKGTDELQLQNTAFIYPGQDNTGKYILFDLTSVKNGADFYGFRFYTPVKEGTFAVENAKKNGYRCSVRMDFNLKSTDNFAIYTGDAVTVTIEKLTSSRISGTFSGEFKLSDLSRSKPYKAQVSVTNGKFDIPFSTGNLRPE
ncbi:MAG TPA: hypothetical protein VGM30_13510 [Puia sp.]|jgi:hypothetical protein